MLETSEASRESAQFWNAQPCDGLDSFAGLARMRYARNAWLPEVLAAVARQNDIVEVGCGQAKDAIEICRRMAPGVSYRGFDHSEVSFAGAQAAKVEASSFLKVEPNFDVQMHFNCPWRTAV